MIRKHATMLTDAGVDVIIFDTTNGYTYQDTYRRLLDTFADIRAQGENTPQIAFLTPFGTPRQVVVDLYQNLYQPGIHPELWFHWGGQAADSGRPRPAHPSDADRARLGSLAAGFRPRPGPDVHRDRTVDGGGCAGTHLCHEHLGHDAVPCTGTVPAERWSPANAPTTSWTTRWWS